MKRLFFATTCSFDQVKGFGCAGPSGISGKPLDTKSSGLFLIDEVCVVNDYAEAGNLMLSKLITLPK